MSNLFDYNAVPASNNSASPNGAPEGMSPSQLNDVQRQMMANEAGAFTCYTAGGTADAQTVTMSPTLAAYSNKVRIAFIPVANNTGACTLNVNGLGATAIKMLDGTDPPAGALNSSGVSIVQHNGTNFVLLNPAWPTPTVSGYVSGMRTYIHVDGSNSDRLTAISFSVTEETFESIGPTGSGATNIWAAMDDIPAGARIAIIGAIFTYDPTAADTASGVEIFIRATGSSASVGLDTTATSLVVSPDDDVAGSSEAFDIFYAPLDSSRRFDFTWDGVNADATPVVSLFLKGFIL